MMAVVVEDVVYVQGAGENMWPYSYVDDIIAHTEKCFRKARMPSRQDLSLASTPCRSLGRRRRRSLELDDPGHMKRRFILQ